VSRTILYIDDRPDLPAGFDQELRREGFRLRHTADPEEAIRQVREAPPALVLIEIELAGCDGLDLLGGIRHLHAEPVPTVVLTRSPRLAGLYGEAVARGARDFLTKPVRPQDLMASVRSHAAGAARGPEPLDVGDDAAGHESRGGLARMPVPEILRELRQHGSSGVLILSRGDLRVGVQLRNGSPVAVSSNRESEPIEDFLLRSGWIDRELRDRVSEQAALGKQSAHEILVALDALPEERMQLALCRLAEERLFETFGWGEGRYRFFLGRRLRPDEALDCDPERVLLDGVLHAFPLEPLRERVLRRSHHYASRADGARFDDLDLSPHQQRALEGLDGEIRVASVLHARVLDERLLYALWIAGRLELHAAPTLVLTEALAEVVAEAEDEVLRADEREADADPARALGAESWFRKGEAFLSSKSYEKAVEAFGMAAHLDPDEGEYLSHLGYALYLSNPKKSVVQREALEHVANGIKRSPDRENSYVFLGRILRLTGDEKTARKIFRKALKINPGCHAALQELRLMELRAQKSPGGGFLSRLRGR